MVERVYRLGFVRKSVILAVLALAWEAYGRWLGNPLLFPTFGQTVEAFVENIANGIIPERMLVSRQTLVIHFSTTPRGIMQFAEFMNKAGSIKVKPTKWSGMFVPQLAGRSGS